MADLCSQRALGHEALGAIGGGRRLLLRLSGSAGFATLAFHQDCAPEDSILSVVGAVRAGRGYSREPTNTRRPAQTIRWLQRTCRRPAW